MENYSVNNDVTYGNEYYDEGDEARGWSNWTVRGTYYSNSTINLTGDTATKAFRKYPNNFVLPGIINNDVIHNRGNSSAYWSSTVHSYDFAYYLLVNNDYVYPGTTSYNKFTGRSIRCLATPSS